MVLAVAALLIILVPIGALGWRVPWAELPGLITRPDTLELLRLTVLAAVLSAAITTLLGVPLAIWIQSLRRGSHLVRVLVLLPLAMPPVVGGLALSAAIGNRGFLAPLLDALGWQFAFTFPGVVAAHIFVALPFVVVSVDAALRQVDREILLSAAGIGMRPAAILRDITLPTIAPAIATGAGLAFARSLGEFGTTITFAGSMPGITRTMSLAIYLEREIDRDAAYGLAAILIAVAVVVLGLAFLPTLLRRDPTPAPRTVHTLDAARLRELTAPVNGGLEVSVNGTTFPADAFTAVVGPNGSGKTTLMSLIAGRLQGADITIGGREVNGVPAHRRGVVMLTQRPGLPAHVSVDKSITMATRDPARTAELLDAAGLHELSDMPVAALSGGQAAQVALVRALATRPRVLLLDEPLAAIDVQSSGNWRQLLRATAADRTTLMVTHDPVDLAGLCDHIAVIDHGRIDTLGPAGHVLRQPPTDFVAHLAGINRIEATIIDATAPDHVRLDATGLAITGVPADTTTVTPGAAAVATFPPEATTLRLPSAQPAPRESARNVWPGEVTSIAGTSVTIRLVNQATIRVPVTRSALDDLKILPGDKVECITKAVAITIHPRMR